MLIIYHAPNHNKFMHELPKKMLVVIQCCQDCEQRYFNKYKDSESVKILPSSSCLGVSLSRRLSMRSLHFFSKSATLSRQIPIPRWITVDACIIISSSVVNNRRGPVAILNRVVMSLYKLLIIIDLTI